MQNTFWYKVGLYFLEGSAPMNLVLTSPHSKLITSILSRFSCDSAFERKSMYTLDAPYVAVPAKGAYACTLVTNMTALLPLRLSI